MRSYAYAVVLIIAIDSAVAQPPAGRTSDLVPPEIIVTGLPTVATSNATKFKSTFADNVELAYVRTGSAASSIYSQPFVFLREGVKYYQLEDTLSVPLGQTITATLMAVDTSGNVAKKTVTVVAPDVRFKEGNYTLVGNNKYPAGFDCTASWYSSLPYPWPYAPLDGQTYPNLSVRYTVGEWSVSKGYSPEVSGFSPGSTSALPPPPPGAALIPLDAISFPFEKQGPGAGYNQYSFVAKYVGTAQVIQLTPPTIQLSFRMSCNLNNTGWVDGTTAVFTGQLQQ